MSDSLPVHAVPRAATGRRVPTIVQGFVIGLVDFLLPRRCSACGLLLGDEESGVFCTSCETELADAAYARCVRCSAPLGPADAHTHAGRCSACRTAPLAFARSWTAGDYRGTLRDLVMDLKFRGRTNLASALAGLLGRRLCERTDAVPWDGIVGVPTHPWRVVRRGYNPVELLCRRLSGMLPVPHVRALRLTRRIPSQRGLSQTARLLNVRGAFAVRSRVPVEGRRFLLVDDVMTTGATASECARTLKRAGAAAVEVAVVAKTPID